MYEKIEGILERCREVVPGDEGEEADTNVDAAGPVRTPKHASEINSPLKAFTIRLDDPAGNSFAEFVGSMSDPKWNMRTYHRTREHNIQLGLVSADEAPKEAETEEVVEEQIGESAEGQNEEIYKFPGTCSSCGHPSDTLIKKVNIPYFKESNRN